MTNLLLAQARFMSHLTSSDRKLYMYHRKLYYDVSYTTGSCIMMFHISYLAYSVNYIVSLLITTRTNRVGDYNT